MTRWALFILLMGEAGCFGTLEHTSTDERTSNNPNVASSGSMATAVGGMVTTPPAPSDANAFYGAVRCQGSSLAVCDSFEDEQLNPNTWQIEVSDANQQLVRLDNTRAARGNRSMLLQTPNNGYQHAMIAQRGLFPVPNNTFYGRAFVYFTGDMPLSHFSLVTASGTLPQAAAPTYVRYGGQYGVLQANYVGADQTQTAGVNMNGTWFEATALPANRWTCMEWEFKGDTNEAHFWLDGQEVQRLAVMGMSNDCCTGQPWTAPPYDSVAMGWEVFSTSQDPNIQAYNVWLDEVALDPNRIGCVR